MKRLVLSAGCLFAAVAVIGCNDSQSTGNVATTTGGAATVAANGAAPKKDLPPDETVRLFLEAIRQGLDQQAESMLTSIAREEAERNDLAIAPPGSETATYTVGDVEVLPAGDVAHVSSLWKDEEEEHEIIWALRKEEGEWRVAGMAVRVFADAPPMLLNFEDAEDMLNQTAMFEQEMVRRAQMAATDEEDSAEGTTEDGSEVAVTADASDSDAPAATEVEEEVRVANEPEEEEAPRRPARRNKLK